MCSSPCALSPRQSVFDRFVDHPLLPTFSLLIAGTVQAAPCAARSPTAAGLHRRPTPRREAQLGIRDPLRMKLKAVYLIDPEVVSSVYGPDEQRDLRHWVEFILPPTTPAATLANPDALRDVEAIFSGWGIPRLDEAVLARMPSLRVVFHGAGSVKHFVSDALWSRDIRVTCAARMNAVPVAEFTLSQILFCLKHGWQRVADVRERRLYIKEDIHMPGAFGTTVGLISLGHTGRFVAEHLRRFDLKVIAYDPYLPPEEAMALGVELVSLDDVFSRADVVSCHTPLLPQTRGLLRGQHFERMRPGASFINTARGAVVNEREMAEVMRQRPDLFAVLDVTDPEPPEEQSLVLTLPNIIVTPHIAGSLGRECRRMGRMMVDELQRFLRGEKLEGEIFPQQLPLLA